MWNHKDSYRVRNGIVSASTIEHPSLGLVFFPAFDWKISATHPERQERLLYTRDQIVEEGLLDVPNIREYNPIVADWDVIERVHVGAPDLQSWVTDAHRVSAGGAIAAADAVLRGEVDRAFALVRPPGHHAMAMVHGIRGFCTINIEAVMVQHIRKTYGVKRVAIVDTDVHHGDGSQDVFYHDPDTLYISFHQDGRTLYPGTGFMDEFGGPQAIGANIDIPLPPGTGDEGLLKVMRELVLPILHEFKPDIVINSAGQDNHFSDPLANMNVTAKGYAELVDLLQADIAVLEGGYSVQEALPYVNTGIILSMAGLDYSCVIEPNYVEQHQSTDVTRYIDDLILKWKNQWARREEIARDELNGHKHRWVRDYSVYYDESGVQEERRETVRLYPDKIGW
ncbi:MAG: histone deacetylase, partial [Veillonella sp.]|nr:histone deacetylase [Veillonella sp.]